MRDQFSKGNLGIGSFDVLVLIYPSLVTDIYVNVKLWIITSNIVDLKQSIHTFMYRSTRVFPPHFCALVLTSNFLVQDDSYTRRI